jgi:hypothetical protein
VVSVKARALLASDEGTPRVPRFRHICAFLYRHIVAWTELWREGIAEFGNQAIMYTWLQPWLL